ncbi:metal-dependent transcriptional regulator [Solicola sp. PLA-1-18]|uniref:metal-dependent transcriptional regulator n=1 Tax=Solicola sp. PLA-1-18 TaxID=3380532 RepID=UPI003B81BA9D
MTIERPGAATEDYLKTIFALTEWDPDATVTTAAVAAGLEVSASSVSAMVRKMGGNGLVDHRRYGAIALTERGRTEALQVVRRHRLIETYLVEALGYTWDEVHDEAEVLEHAVSGTLVDRMDDALGHPWRDPHGDPIPTPEGTLHQPVSRRLSELDVGERGFVARINDDDPELLRHLSGEALHLDDQVTVRERHRFRGSVTLEVGSDATARELSLGDDVLADVWVTDAPPTRPRGAARGCAYPRCRHLELAAG